jgi:hypothetical protein
MNAKNTPEKSGLSSSSQSPPSKSKGSRGRFQERPNSEKKDRKYKPKRSGRSNYNRNQSSHPNYSKLPLDSLIRKYGNILELHLAARKKYHDLFFRADPRQKARLQRNYYQTLENLRKFENNLKPDEKEIFLKNYRTLTPDTTYSANHEIQSENQQNLVGNNEDRSFEDPHCLSSQKDHSFSEDMEESVGSFDDYKKLKGL